MDSQSLEGKEDNNVRSVMAEDSRGVSEATETCGFSALMAGAGVPPWLDPSASSWTGAPLGGGPWPGAAAIGPRGAGWCGPGNMSGSAATGPRGAGWCGPGSVPGAAAGGPLSSGWGWTEWNASVSAALGPDWRNIEEIGDERTDIGRSSVPLCGTATRRRGGGRVQKPPAAPVAPAPDTIDLTDPRKSRVLQCSRIKDCRMKRSWKLCLKTFVIPVMIIGVRPVV